MSHSRGVIDVVTSFFAAHAVSDVQLHSYDDFVDYGIPEVVNDVRPIIWFDKDDRKKTVRISMCQPRLAEPSMTPRLCRQLLKSYTSALLVDLLVVVTTSHAQKQQTLPNVSLGDVPVMVGSKVCLMGSGKVSHTDAGEMPGDVGFFVINGQEKVIISQEKVASNVPVLFKLHAYNSSLMYVCEIRSSSSHIKIPVTFSVRLHDVVQCPAAAVFCVLSFFRTDVPLFLLLYALGAISTTHIVTKIAHFARSTTKEMYCFLEPSLREVTHQTQADAIVSIGRQMGASNATEAHQCAHDVLHTSLLPHIEVDDKLQFIFHMTALLYRYTTSRTVTEDRDTLANKRIETSGVLVSQQLRQSIQKARSNIERNLAKAMTSNERLMDAFSRCDVQYVASSVVTFFVSHTITKPLMYTMATGNIQLQATGSAAGQRTGVVQLYCRYNIVTCFSQLRRINTPIERVGKASKPRVVHHSQCGFLCPVETPEGPSCGLIKNLSLGAIVTTFRHSQHSAAVKGILCETMTLPPYATETNEDGVFFNGSLIGFVSDASDFVAEIRRMKLTCGPFRDALISVWVNYDGHVYVHSEEGRVVRFFFLPHISEEAISGLQGADWSVLLGSGFFVFADAAETVTHTVATCVSKRSAESTLCEIHPMLLLGVTASSIPFIQCNQSPRNTYQTSMTKQALGSPCVHELQTDALTPCLLYPQNPIVYSASDLLLDKNRCQLGGNWVVAVQSHAGNQNDSVVINKASVERGLGVSLHTTVVKIELRHPETLKGIFDHRQPPVVCIGQTVSIGTRLFEYTNTLADTAHDYNYKGEEGGRVTGVELIIGGRAFVQQKDWTYTCNGVFYKDWQIRMKTYYLKCAFRNIVLRIRLGSIRSPEVGDKVASRHGQKGTIGTLVETCDMPFCLDGTVPDLMFNAHGIPSRMTIGQLWEQIIAKLQAIVGQQSPCGIAFGKHDELSACFRDLHFHGYSPTGKEKMFCGISGEPLDGQIFIGLVFYQRLKHMVRDKVHARALGPITQLVRQPTDGRSRNGGLRIGEMERDCIIGHGAIAFLRERLLWKSDAYELIVCGKCGNMSATPGLCTVCRTSGDLRKVTLPFSTKLLFQEITAIGIQPRLQLGECSH